jgi:hypothetical protein
VRLSGHLVAFQRRGLWITRGAGRVLSGVGFLICGEDLFEILADSTKDTRGRAPLDQTITPLRMSDRASTPSSTPSTEKASSSDAGILQLVPVVVAQGFERFEDCGLSIEHMYHSQAER